MENQSCDNCGQEDCRHEQCVTATSGTLNVKPVKRRSYRWNLSEAGRQTQT